METYAEFLKRIRSFERPEFGIDFHGFVPSNSVLQKVDEGNRFSSFFGDTVVFDLSSVDKRMIDSTIDQLYEIAGYCFCQRFDMNTLHLTLHDLSSSVNIEEIASAMDKNFASFKRIVSQCGFKPEKIHMKSNYIINMVNTSVVLCFYPASEEEYLKIMKYYSLMDTIVSLPYPFTPHITLAYFNRYGFDWLAARELARVVNELNGFQLEITLNTDMLYYQRFTSMNDFSSLMKITT